MQRFKTGDKVVVISGQDRGRSGQVTKVISDLGRVVVEGVNLANRRIRPRRTGQKGQVVQVALPIHQARVLPWCATCQRGVRIKFNVLAGAKVRLCAKCNNKL